MSSLETLLSPPILFFLLGMVAVWLRSDLRLPEQISKFISIYLLMGIGLHGGVELSRSGLSLQVCVTLLFAALASAIIPIWCFFILRRKLDVPNAAAIAATYGSISAVTFVTGIGVLQNLQLPYGGHMIAAMAVMESPAIIVGVLLARWCGYSPARETQQSSSSASRSPILEAVVSGPVILLMGSLAIGFFTGDEGWKALKPVLGDPFKGVLTLFLLDMGIIAASSLKKLPESSLYLMAFAIAAALFHACLGIATGRLLGLPTGDTFLLAILFGSASYIAVPAAAKMALPEANAGIYLPMSLGITFPFNVLVGIPLYLALSQMDFSRFGPATATASWFASLGGMLGMN